MCLCLRLHERNPWVLEHLALQLRHYAPRPRIVVADLGSAPEFAGQIQALTVGHGARYVRDEYAGAYSAARAHNVAAAQVETDFVFFTDPDCFAVDDIFGRLARLLSQTGIGAQLDLMLNFAAFHLGEDLSERFKALPDPLERSALLESARVDSLFAVRGAVEFAAPYANVFLCRRDGFNLAGGYNENFVGYGSEDFEFLLRFATLMNQYTPPVQPADDGYRPYEDEFFPQRDYHGFRRLLEAMSFLAEVNGLAAFHLKHPVPLDIGWHQVHDRGRQVFRAQVRPYLDDRRGLLGCDWLPRSQVALVIAEREWQADLFLPLRLAGYRLILATGATLGKLAPEALDAFLRERAIQVVAVGRPTPEESVKSVQNLREGVRRLGLGWLSVERGPWPESWAYVSEAAPGLPAAEESQRFTEAELAVARAYRNLAQASATPETRTAPEEELAGPDEAAQRDLAGRLLRRYSFFAEKSDQGARNSSEAEPAKLLLYHFSLAGRNLVGGERAAIRHPLRPRSYLLARLGLMSDQQWAEFERDGRVRSSRLAAPGLARRLEAGLVEKVLRVQEPKLVKYRRNRSAFFRDSKSVVLRLYGRFFA